MRNAVTEQRSAIEDARQTVAAVAKGRRKAVLREAALPPHAGYGQDRQRMEARRLWLCKDVRHLHSRLQLQASFSAELYSVR